jgi:hypothetical protein
VDLPSLKCTYQIAVSFSNYFRGKDLKYTKKFNSTYELNAFVNFHKEETCLNFSFDLELKTAWIEVDKKIHQELTHTDMLS